MPWNLSVGPFTGKMSSHVTPGEYAADFQRQDSFFSERRMQFDHGSQFD
jgi:hypothetical protein